MPFTVKLNLAQMPKGRKFARGYNRFLDGCTPELGLASKRFSLMSDWKMQGMLSFEHIVPYRPITTLELRLLHLGITSFNVPRDSSAKEIKKFLRHLLYEPVTGRLPSDANVDIAPVIDHKAIRTKLEGFEVAPDSRLNDHRYEFVDRPHRDLCARYLLTILERFHGLAFDAKKASDILGVLPSVLKELDEREEWKERGETKAVDIYDLYKSFEIRYLNSEIEEINKYLNTLDGDEKEEILGHLKTKNLRLHDALLGRPYEETHEFYVGTREYFDHYDPTIKG